LESRAKLRERTLERIDGLDERGGQMFARCTLLTSSVSEVRAQSDKDKPDGGATRHP